MSATLVSSPHGSRPNRVDRVMQEVLLALVPGVLAMIWFFGWGVLVNVMLSVLFAVMFEALMVALRRRPVAATLGDSSAVLAGWLFALAIPPLAPVWVLLIQGETPGWLTIIGGSIIITAVTGWCIWRNRHQLSRRKPGRDGCARSDAG